MYHIWTKHTVMDRPSNLNRLTHLKNGPHRNFYETILFQYRLRGCTNIFENLQSLDDVKTCDSLGGSARIQTPTA